MDIKRSTKRLGEERLNKCGRPMKIIEYNNQSNIKIQFDDGLILENRTYTGFKNGNIFHPYDRTVMNKGYIGIGKYKHGSLAYTYWQGMLRRIYNEIELKKRPTYRDCSVCEEWHNFQIFGEWFDENYYEVNNELMAIDKDMLVKGNRIYSPETCLIVPQRINGLIQTNKTRRNGLPIGVQWEEDRQKYSATCTIQKNGKKTNKRIGRFNTPEEAFYAYKEFKEKYIKEVADEYKDKIPKKLYDAMYNYKVDIND